VFRAAGPIPQEFADFGWCFTAGIFDAGSSRASTQTSPLLLS
jgi:hypothetical protein